MINNAQFSFFNGQLFSDDLVWIVIKWMAIVAVGLYTVFAALVVKQTADLARTLEDPANGQVRLVAWIHFIMAITVTVIMILFL